MRMIVTGRYGEVRGIAFTEKTTEDEPGARFSMPGDIVIFDGEVNLPTVALAAALEGGEFVRAY